MTFPIYPGTERQKRLVALAGELADTFARRANEGEWAGHFPYENYRDLHQSGYLALTVPREFGGEGADVLDTLLAQARLAQGCASTALVTAMHLSTIGRIAASTHGPNPLFERICASVVHDGALINGAATASGTGSPNRGGQPATTARRQIDGSWLLNGRKTYTTGSLKLRFFLVSCSIEDDTPVEAKLPRLPSDQASFLVPRDAPGIRIEETWESVSRRTSASNDLILANVHLGPNALADTLGNFTPASMAQLGAWSFPLHAVYLGIAQGARDEAIRFAQRWRPNSLDQPISSVPHIQEKIAKIELILLQSEAVIFRLVEQYLRDATSISSSQFAAAKYLVTNHAVEVVDLAMRIVGGASLSLQKPLQRYYRDVRAGLYHPPMDDATFSLLCQQALKER
ncbi:putative acyl-CoA dehydrogenase YdbM [Dictyobacter alpinus]|uniref:Putative acyl-CoA dehydrogenase YdbM n=1 Tax=Dictyobacter alpinus TaxID=2014873 RepID=A0A402BFH0_9CHLR|nr:acyl-CoA dehydrogenase family protein [Dictyobacter alpinus]GCE30022.1 putative acyl-CoA dehydrogenase YdbM [Dictyobacter alpinus]